MNVETLDQAFLGSLVADAMALPVHWYYDTSEIDRVYGELVDYQNPVHPHTGSIFFRSHYQPLNEKGDILGDQAQFWGQQGIHYHQSLRAGDNTINYFLAQQLYQLIIDSGEYSTSVWLDRYIEIMLDPSSHGDTYLEEYHRNFFTNYAKGIDPLKCGSPDIHIGGLAQVPAILAGLAKIGIHDPNEIETLVQNHISLTHNSRVIIEAALNLTRLLLALANGNSLAESISQHANGYVGIKKLDKWKSDSDRTIVGNRLSPACYLPDSFTASLFIVWKYQNDFSSGIIANAQVGGDSCHRGAVVGSLLAAENGIPKRWRQGLSYQIIA